MKLIFKHPCKNCITKPICLTECEIFEDYREQIDQKPFGLFCVLMSIMVIFVPILLLSYYKSWWYLLLIVAVWSLSSAIIYLAMPSNSNNNFDFQLYLMSPISIITIFIIINPIELYMYRHLPKQVGEYQETIVDTLLGRA